MKMNLDSVNLKMNTMTSIINIETGNDPLGKAILDFKSNQKSQDIIVSSDICDDDIIPSEYLFRSFEQMPEIEKIALSLCHGKVLDVGAGAGIHSTYLMEKGFDVEAIDISLGAVDYMKSKGINAYQANFFELNDDVKFDSLLMLMNGIGIAGELNKLSATLLHAKKRLNPNGTIICDSTDIKYLYEDEEGGYWVDFNSEYYGNFNFQMSYKDQKTDWFKWLYVDFDTLKNEAERIGFSARKIMEVDDQYLAELKRID